MAKVVLEVVLDSKGNVQAIKQAGKDLEEVEKGGKKAAEGMNGLQRAVKVAAGAFAAWKMAQGAIEFVRLGAQVQATQQRFEAFAGGPKQAAEFLDVFGEATDHTVDKMGAMAGASKMLQMGLVDNADEMGTMAAVAVKLGNQTMGAGDRIADFSALLANRSIPRLDNFGISSGKVRDRVEELKKAGYGIDEAFKMAVLEQGRLSLAKLGDTSELTATKIGQLDAAFADAKNGTALFAAELVDDVVGVETFSERLRGLPDTLRQLWMMQKGATSGLNEFWDSMARGEGPLQAVKDGIGEFGNSIKRDLAKNATSASEILRYMHTTDLPAVEKAFVDAKLATGVYGDSLDELADRSGRSLQRMAEMAEATQQSSQRMMEFSTGYTELIRQRKSQDDKYYQDSAKVEAEHQGKLNDIRKKGQATAVHIDEEAEQEKLEALRRKLEIALQQQAEFTDKTKQSTLMSKETQLSTLQNQIAEQTQLLDDYHAGRLVSAGQNVSALVAQEEERYRSELEMLQVSRAAQEEEQRRSLGQMLLQHMTTYGEMSGWTADEMLQMQLKISEEYGLITAEGRAAAENAVASWGRTFAVMRGDADSFFGAFKAQFASLPTEHKIRITYELSKPQTQPGRLGGETKAAGGFSAGGLAMINEQGPELVVLPPRSYVYNAAETGRMVRAGAGGGGGTQVVVNNYFGRDSVRSDDDVDQIVSAIERTLTLRGARVWNV